MLLRVAVTGPGSRLGHGIIRAFRLCDSPPWLLGLDTSALAAGLYHCDARSILPPSKDEVAWLDALVAALSKHRIQLLVPGRDPELPLLARHRDRLEATGCRVLISTPDFLDLTLDKLLSYENLAPLGVPFVRTTTPEAVRENSSLFQGPMVLKPRIGSGSKHVQLIRRLAELPAHLSNGEWILQDYLRPATQEEGEPITTSSGAFRQEDEVNIQGLVGPKGEVVACFLSRNRLVEGVTQNVRPLENQVLMNQARRIITILAEKGLRGPGNIQGRISREGFTAYEINPRFTGNSAARTALGYPECRMALGMFVEGWTPAQAQSLVNIQYDHLCLRYWDEIRLPLSDLKYPSL